MLIDLGFANQVYVVLARVLSAFADRANEFIKWSTGPEQAISEACFRQCCKILGMIIAAIDGTHMPIVRPQKYEDEYIYHKGFHSVNVQIVAKHDKIIRIKKINYMFLMHCPRHLQPPRIKNIYCISSMHAEKNIANCQFRSAVICRHFDFVC